MINTIYAGGLIGCVDSSATVKTSFSAGNITVVSSSNGFAYAGGFVALNKGTIENCLAFGDVTAQGKSETYSRNGGFVASNSGTLTNCLRSNEQELTQYVTVGVAYCNDGIESTVANMILFAKENWSNLIWIFGEQYPTYK